MQETTDRRKYRRSNTNYTCSVLAGQITTEKGLALKQKADQKGERGNNYYTILLMVFSKAFGTVRRDRLMENITGIVNADKQHPIKNVVQDTSPSRE